MDVVFACPNCRQELEADASGAGTQIACPECGFALTIPEPSPRSLKPGPAGARPSGAAPSGAQPGGAAPASPPPAAAERPPRKLVVPQTESSAKVEISRPRPSLEVAAKGADKRLRVRTFRHLDYSAHGPEAFDQAVSEFLQAVGEGNIHGVMPVQYSFVDSVRHQVMTDFGLVVYFRG